MRETEYTALKLYLTRTAKDEVKRLFIDKNLTLREVCKELNVPFHKRLPRLFNMYFPKGAGHGGVRKGSGRKKIKAQP